jgi:hypothetical protein
MKTESLFKHLKANKSESGIYIQFEMKTLNDDTIQDPASNDEGFWPSLDKDSAGYVGENPSVSFEKQMQQAKDRMDAYENNEWCYVGVYAVAKIYDYNGSNMTSYSLQSSGIWGVESDCNEALVEHYNEQIDELKDLLSRMNNIHYI